MPALVNLRGLVPFWQNLLIYEGAMELGQMPEVTTAGRA